MGGARGTGGPSASTLLVGLAMMGACSSGPIALGRLEDTTTPALDSGTVSDSGGIPDASVDAALCDPPAPSRHYAFDGLGTEVIDLRGGPSGQVVGGATLDGSGVLRLDGVDDYVDLPNGILAGLTEVSVALWVRRLGGPGYTRLFDIGTGSLGEDPPAGASTVGRSYLAVTPGTGNVPSGLAVLMSAGGAPSEVVALSDVVLDQERRFVVVAVSNATVSLYYEGALVARVPRTVPLPSIVDHNAWLGRSQYSADPYLTAEYSDVRIWTMALPDCAVHKLHALGPDAR
ncbi:MAG: hypothetical protein BGO98_01590 [Myxococcales bacterium 68-20]|nr:LamG domain-containing protein [Myxococcales bacterium]OJY19964.1 MAG: hypothetical protein BGO98_01590 [Myxococcales bacterium 68-20]